jgi:hypothetical protein
MPQAPFIPLRRSLCWAAILTSVFVGFLKTDQRLLSDCHDASEAGALGETVAEPNASGDNNWAWLIALAIGGALLFGVSMCSSVGDQQTTSAVDSATATDTPTPEPTPTPVLTLTKASSLRAARDFQRAELEPGGDKVYSENCYLSLDATFSWPKLDACAAFDQLVIRWINSDNFDGSSDVDYFDSETTAGRYLAVATAHGETGEEADQRFAVLQNLAGKVRLRLLEAAPVETSESDDDADGVGSGQAPGSAMSSDDAGD